MKKFPVVAVLVALSTAIAPIKLWAGSKITVGEKVPAARQVSIDRIDHSVWDALLRKYCDSRGYVDYQAWHDSQVDTQQLDAYLTHLSHANRQLSASQASQLAFWINAYNAVTVRGILREYPTSSIRNHTAKLIGYNIWDDLLLPVGDKSYSLNQMEHEILRKMGEPRIHFSIVCASVGCPPLMNRAFTAQELDAQLTDNAKRFFADPDKFASTSQGELKLSKILQWFPTDFGPHQAAQLRAIAPYLPNPAAQALATSGRARVSYLEYDWGLNDQAAQRK